MRKDPDAKTFLADVAEHKMEIAHASGVYRHIRFRQPRNSINWFDIVTWPRHLTIAGDMGTWTFARVPDMFCFFRRSGDLSINESYWSEKLQNGVSGSRASAQSFDVEHFGQSLIDQLENYYSLDGNDLIAVTAAVKEDVLCHGNEQELQLAARDFECDLSDGSIFTFECSELPDGMQYEYQFVWCLYAIVWGIQQWDAHAAQQCDDPHGLGDLGLS